MAKSDEEFDLCSTTPPHTRADFFGDCGLDCVQEPSSYFNWKVVKRRQRRRYTISHAGGAPPAPPSTPTSLTATATPTPSPTATINTNSLVAATTANAEADERLNNLLYILDCAPKYKKKFKEQQRTDAELASLLNVITLSSNSSSSCSSGGGVGGGGNGVVGGRSSGTVGTLNMGHPPLEHRICAASRTIKKSAASTKIFKIHRNPKWFFREPELEEDSVSAPEYDDSEEREHLSARCRRQLKRRSLLVALRQRRFARFEQQERMEDMVHEFGSAMTFNEV